jgi:serine/threonine protein kinase
MGVVYEAEQLSLRRRVALKVLPSSAAGSKKHRQRFQREAESAARLHHGNIVPVFGIGKCKGLLCYVMQYIDGVGLDEVVAEVRHLSSREDASRSSTSPRRLSETREIRPGATVAAMSLCEGTFWQDRGDRRSSLAGAWSTKPFSLSAPTNASHGGTLVDRQRPLAKSVQHLPAERVTIDHRYFKSIAHVGLQLANALAYSHRQGILHRDIKPSNLLLDREGNVWITDFGLAKHESHVCVTATGDVVGTLRYMAPEQFHGQTDARSDVYGLGLTLYELATLRAGFEETKHGPLIRLKNETVPPAPRNVCASIPRDLDTIVLKAIASDPDDRYQNADKLAADLKRFLLGKPVEARRVTPVGRVWRWCRRNKAVAALSGIAALSLLAVALLLATRGGDTMQEVHEGESAAPIATTEEPEMPDREDTSASADDTETESEESSSDSQDAAYGIAKFFQRMDQDGDGKLAKSELPEHIRRRWEFLDANLDGFLDQGEVARSRLKQSVTGGRRGMRPQSPRWDGGAKGGRRGIR